jgi:hypothetical protein
MPPNSKRWMEAAIRFNRFGAKNSNSMLPKMHPVNFYSVNAGPLRKYNLDSIYEASGRPPFTESVMKSISILFLSGKPTPWMPLPMPAEAFAA